MARNSLLAPLADDQKHGVMPCRQDAVCGVEGNILQGTTLEVVSFQGVVALKHEVYVDGVLNLPRC